ncbi:MAG: S9 family peptidase [Salibacteraceae bacterium]
MSQAPVANKIDHEMTLHGHTRNDPYFWMRERDSKEVLDYLKAENDYLDTELKHTEGLQEKLYEEIVGRIKQSDLSVPYLSNGYYYYSRFEEGKEYPIFCRKKGNLEAEEEIMLDGNVMAEGQAFFQIGGLSVSPNNKLLAYGVDNVSRRLYTIRVKNLETGEILEDKIENATGSVAWANDNQTFFYTKKDEESLRAHQNYRYKLGSNESELVFEESDDTFGTFVYRTKSSDYIMMGSYSTLSNEYHFLSTDTPEGDFQVIQPRERELEYSISHYGDHFYIVTNLEAINFRLMKAPVNNCTKENWEEVIAHRENVMLEDIEIFKEYLVVDERKDGLNHIRVIRWNDNEEHYLDFGEATYLAYVSVNREFDTDILRFGYTSLTTPNSVFDYNLKTREKTLLKQQEIVGGYDPEGYQAERLYATARDGVKVPISLVYKKGIEKNGKNPLLLYGYGSYGSSMDPFFSSSRLSLLDRGFVFAIAHIRGGQELGRLWYEDGKLLKKMNTFNDFIDCGDFLIAQNLTSKEHLYAMGGSAGGLLMGAIINQRPDLWNGVVSQVPFVDVITTMLDESIPLTTGEYDEWGNPNDKAYYDYILSYSPYDNVAAKDYPAMLVTTGYHDSQVQYWEPAKWVAKLRDMKTSDQPLYFSINMEAGHGGASGRFAQHKETALEYAFLLDREGLKE